MSTNHVLRRLSAGFAVLLLSCLLSPARAESFGDYEIHYGTLTTDFLTPAVAQKYGVQRSTSTAMLTVTVLKRGQNNATVPVDARIDANITNEYGQYRRLNMRRVQDGDAIYYLDTFHISPPENYRFQLSVQPAGSKDVHRISFNRLFDR